MTENLGFAFTFFYSFKLRPQLCILFCGHQQMCSLQPAFWKDINLLWDCWWGNTLPAKSWCILFNELQGAQYPTSKLLRIKRETLTSVAINSVSCIYLNQSKPCPASSGRVPCASAALWGQLLWTIHPWFESSFASAWERLTGRDQRGLLGSARRYFSSLTLLAGL